MFNRRRLLALPAATLALTALSIPGSSTASSPQLAALSADDQALVAQATAYLQSLEQARARFLQVDARGQRSAGALYLKRPGKARFAYDPPSGLLVVSDGGVVSVADARLKTFDSYPLAATPLSLFLARNIRLDQGVVVARVARRPGAFEITVRDSRKQAAGQLTLTFTSAPLSLAGWTVTDAQGRPTQVRLSDLQRVNGLDPGLFILKNPKPPNLGRGKM